jgi:hypothetical protein
VEFQTVSDPFGPERETAPTASMSSQVF